MFGGVMALMGGLIVAALGSLYRQLRTTHVEPCPSAERRRADCTEGWRIFENVLASRTPFLTEFTELLVQECRKVKLHLVHSENFL